MEKAGWGGRIKARARELGLADAAVARLLGVAQRTFSAYANETREPRFAVLVEICRILRTTPDAVLGYREHPVPGPTDGTEVRVRAALVGMASEDREKALAVLETMAGTRMRRPRTSKAAGAEHSSASDTSFKPAQRR